MTTNKRITLYQNSPVGRIEVKAMNYCYYSLISRVRNLITKEVHVDCDYPDRSVSIVVDRNRGDSAFSIDDCFHHFDDRHSID